MKQDLERGITPVHAHVEAQIVKGKYGDYDTFLGPEAIEPLNLNLDCRRKGVPIRTGVDRTLPPESITDTSLLIRDEHTVAIRPISPARIHDIIHDLHVRTGLLREGSRT